MDDRIIGAWVQIKSKSHYHGRFAGKFGEVVQDYEGSIAIRIDGINNPRSKYGAFWFKENEIEIIESEETIMDENYVTAEVAFLNGTNIDKTYRYALYDSSIQPEDIVVVQTGHHGLAVARIVSVAGEPNGPVSHGREVICRVDMSAYKERKARAAQLVELKARMDSKVKQLQKAAVYEMLAEKDPELAAMLQTYKELLGQ